MVDKTKGVLGTIGKGLSGLALGVGAAGVAAAGVAVTGLGAGLAVAISEATEAEDVMSQLEAVLESTGGKAGVTAEAASGLAESLYKVTKFGDEAILSGENILLTFTNIGKDVFPDATETMLDMSQALGQDLKSSAIQLGKALNDPAAGISALSRVGVAFTDDQKALIESLVEEGRVMDAQKIILQELQTEFGGSAKAAGETFTGQLEILKNQMLNVAESAGTVLIPILTDGMAKIGPVLIALAENFAEFISSDQFKTWLAETADFIETSVVPAMTAFGDFASTVLIPALVEIAKWIGENVVPALVKFAEYVTTTLIPALVDVAELIGENVVPVLAQLFEWLGVVIPPVLKAMAFLWTNVVVPALKAFWNFLEPIIKLWLQFFTKTIPDAIGFLRRTWESDFMGIKSFLEGVWNGIKLIFSAFQKAAAGDWYGFGETIRKIFENVWTTIKNVASGIVKTIGNFIANVIQKFKETDWLQIGKNIMTGIAEGIDKFKDILFDAAIRAAMGALDAIKGFLGIQSPSKVMEDQVGKQMAAGISKGFMNGIAEMSSGFKFNTNNLVPAFSSASSVASPGSIQTISSASQRPINITIQAGTLLSFANESDLERKLKPLIQKWIRV